MSTAAARRRRQRNKGAAEEATRAKLASSLDSGDYYGALQMYRTVVSRWLKRAEAEVESGSVSGSASASSHFGKAEKTAHEGAMGLLKKGQASCGADLSTVLFKLWNEHRAQVDDRRKELVKELNSAFIECLQGSDATAEDKNSYYRVMRSFAEWSAKCGAYASGDPALQLLCARSKVFMGDLPSAAEHYVHAHEPKEFASVLVKWSKMGYKSERSAFLARAVLQLLCQENIKDASALRSEFVSIWKHEGVALDDPLMNVTGYLIETVQRDAAPLFKLLRDKYAPCLASDPSFAGYLDRIGRMYFNIRVQKTGMAAMMENMMSMFGAPPQ